MNTWLLRIMSRAFDHVLNITALLAGMLVVFQMLIVCWDVILRYFFNSPTSWVPEISAYTVLWIPFLAAGWILRRDGHVKMDLLLGRLRPNARSELNIVTSSIAAIVCLILTYYGVKVVIDLYRTNFHTQTGLMLPKWPIISVIPLSTYLLFVEQLRRIKRLLGH